METSIKCKKDQDEGGKHYMKQNIFFGAVYSYNKKETIFRMAKNKHQHETLKLVERLGQC